MRLYLDHNATTPVDVAVAAAMNEVLLDQFGNPSSVHSFGQATKAAVDEARQAVADLLGARPQEIVFTSGGTESDNLALRGVAEAQAQGKRHHIVTTAIEHEAVLHTVKALTKRGWTATILPVGQTGVVEPEALESAITEASAICVGTLAQRSEAGRNTIYRCLDRAAGALRVYDVNLRKDGYRKEWIEATLERTDVVKLNHD